MGWLKVKAEARKYDAIQENPSLDQDDTEGGDNPARVVTWKSAHDRIIDKKIGKSREKS